jgi:hypothetical protein
MRKKVFNKKSFNKVRQFRIDSKNYNWLKKQKKINKGTWNYLFLNMRIKCKNISKLNK